MFLRPASPGPAAPRLWVLWVALGCLAGIAAAATFPAAPAYDAPAFFLDGAAPGPSSTSLGIHIAAVYADDFAALPFKGRYDIDDHLSLDLAGELLRRSRSDAAGRHTALGCGDLWVGGRVVGAAGPARAGGRAAFKIPTGYYNPADGRPDLGDGQADVDLALVAGAYPPAGGFRCDWIFGYRYRRESTYMVWQQNPLEPEKPIGIDIDIQPGALWYMRFEPGFMCADGKLGISVPFFYGIAARARLEVMGVYGNVAASAASAAIIGAGLQWRVRPGWAVSARVLRPVRSLNTPLTTTIYLGGESRIPSRGARAPEGEAP